MIPTIIPRWVGSNTIFFLTFYFTFRVFNGAVCRIKTATMGPGGPPPFGGVLFFYAHPLRW